MRRLIIIAIIGLFFVSCGKDNALQDESIDLPNASVNQERKKSTQKIFMAKTLGCDKSGCSEDDSSTNDSTDDNSNAENDNSDKNSEDDFYVTWRGNGITLNGDNSVASVRQRYKGTRNTTADSDVGVFLSNDSTCTVSDEFLGSQESSLSANDLFDSEDIKFSLPSKVSNGGEWYFCAIADYKKEYIENNELNNIETLQVLNGEVIQPEDEYFSIEASYNQENFTISIKSQNTPDKKSIRYSYDNENWEYLDSIIKKDRKFVTKNILVSEIEDSENHNKIYFQATFKVQGGIATSDIFTLKYTPPVSNTIKTEKEIILTEIQNISWGYYKDKNSERWYISKADDSKKVTVYSLMPIKNGNAGWGLVSKNVASINLDTETITIDNIPDNQDGKYYIAVLDETIDSDRIQPDIERIRNSTVPINWWFFKASNDAWYIVNKQGNVYRFSSKKVDDNGVKSENYDWQKVDLDGAVPTFFVEDGVKKFRF